MIVLYLLFALSVFFPIYTYALYPLILRLLPSKKYKRECIEPSVSVMIVGENADDKIKNVEQCKYPHLEIASGDYSSKANGDIIVFTDTKTKLDLSAIREIVKPFADDRVSCVVGQQTNPESKSVFWKYENRVKQLESKIGCVSGAPKSLFAVRKSDMPKVGEKVLNKPFFITTKILQDGKAVVYQEYAKAYEGATEGTNFAKHVEDASGYWQALGLFPRMLGSFVYVSHRVMKWFVWLNMMMVLLASFFLALLGSRVMAVIFIAQVIGYLVMILSGKRKKEGPLGKMLNIGYYFLMLNVSVLYALLMNNARRN